MAQRTKPGWMAGRVSFPLLLFYGVSQEGGPLNPWVIPVEISWFAKQKQILCGDDRKKGNSKSKGKGGVAIRFEMRVLSCELKATAKHRFKCHSIVGCFQVVS